MEEVFVHDVKAREGDGRRRVRRFRRSDFPAYRACGAALLSALLLVLSFPDFDLSMLAWIALTPLFVAVARASRPTDALFLGWITGAVYFYASCTWLTYPMIHYAGIPSWIAYTLLVPAALILGFFSALACYLLARVCIRWGARALLAAPILWTAGEWSRSEVTGQLWNAIGYTQAYTPALIQSARWGGVFAVGFLVAACSVALAHLFVDHDRGSFAVSLGVLLAVSCVIAYDARDSSEDTADSIAARRADTVIVAVQPNVIPDFRRSPAELRALFDRHLRLSGEALATIEANEEVRDLPRVVIFPESPMNFQYKRDSMFREAITSFAARHRTSVLFNSLEPAPNDGGYNSAVLVGADGELVEQYDKIRLLAFGEYVPLPAWLPGRDFVRAVVGEFTPGERYALMPFGAIEGGVFICYESAFPFIARRFAGAGAHVLVNISNDAYQGPTALMRQHLANSVFRAVENNRPLLRVTNTGITARISPRGAVTDATESYVPAVRTWTIAREERGQTFYTIYGDLFAVFCVTVSVLLFGSTLRLFRPRSFIAREADA